MKPPKAKRGRPSNATRGSAKTKASNLPKKRGRPSKSEQLTRQRQAAEAEDGSGPTRTSKPGRPRKSGVTKQGRIQPPPHASGTRKRKAREAELEDEFEDESVPKKFQHLRVRSRYIPQAVIATKWQAPTQPMQEQIKNIFKIALRPVVESRRDERRRLEAEKVIIDMIKALESRLPRMPFPPRTKETDFDLDKAIERNRTLENQLTPVMHSNDLLKSMIEKEEAQLLKDQEVLAEFESNARAEKAALKDLSVKPHPLLRLPKKFAIGGDSAEDIGLIRQNPAKEAVFNDSDPDLAPLLDTLRNHLESMQGNHEQVQGIDTAMQAAQAALDDVLFQYASPLQYDSISRA